MNILLSAGPTREPIDDVRYISNRSSGKLGRALACRICDRNHELKVVHGPMKLHEDKRGEWFEVETAEEMLTAMKSHFDWADIVILAAAVCDVRPIAKNGEKIEKEKLMHLDFELNPDIAAALGQMKEKQLLVTFSLEKSMEQTRPLQKMKSKNADLCVINQLQSMNSDQSTFCVIDSSGQMQLAPELFSKKDFADELIKILEKTRSS